MSKIDPEAGKKWKEEPENAIEKWKAKNNLQDAGMRRDGGRRSNERSRPDQQQGFPSRINPFESNPGFNQPQDQFAVQRTSKFDEPPFQSGGGGVNSGQNLGGNGILGNSGFPNINSNFNPGNMSGNMNPGNMNMNPGNMAMNPGNMNMNQNQDRGNLPGLGPMFNQSQSPLWY